MGRAKQRRRKAAVDAPKRRDAAVRELAKSIKAFVQAVVEAPKQRDAAVRRFAKSSKALVQAVVEPSKHIAKHYSQERETKLGKWADRLGVKRGDYRGLAFRLIMKIERKNLVQPMSKIFAKPGRPARAFDESALAEVDEMLRRGRLSERQATTRVATKYGQDPNRFRAHYRRWKKRQR